MTDHRPARIDDVEAIVSLVHAAYRGDSSRAGWTTEADLLDGGRTDTAEVRARIPHLIVVENDGEVIGCCSIVPAGEHADFGLFAVRPALQSNGVGSLLLEAAEARAISHGLPRVEMTVLTQRAELIAFYERRGYADTGERRPWPHSDARFGTPLRDDLEFTVLSKYLPATGD